MLCTTGLLSRLSGGVIMETNIEDFALGVFRRVFKMVLYSSLGKSATEAILFFLQNELERNIFEMLWENPKKVYSAMEKILGAGAKILINLLVTTLNREYGLNMNPDSFIELMCSDDQNSIKKIRSFLKKIAEVHEKEEMKMIKKSP